MEATSRRGSTAVHLMQVGDGHPVGEALEQGKANRASLSGPFPLEQRLEDGLVGVESCTDVRAGDTNAGRCLRRAGDREESGLALHQVVVSFHPRVGPLLPVPADAACDQPRMCPPELFRAVGPDAAEIRAGYEEFLARELGRMKKGRRPPPNVRNPAPQACQRS